MKTYETIIWDWNGTLLDDVSLCISIANEILDDYRLPALTTERYREIFDFPVRLYWERAGLDLDQIDFKSISVRFCTLFEERLHEASLYSGVVRILRSLKQYGIQQFLLSNTEHNALYQMANHFEIIEFFIEVRGMDNTLAEGKLSGGSKIIQDFTLNRESTILIGDTTHDAEVAEQLGIDCFLIDVGHQASNRLISHGATVVNAITDIPGLLNLNESVSA